MFEVNSFMRKQKLPLHLLTRVAEAVQQTQLKNLVVLITKAGPPLSRYGRVARILDYFNPLIMTLFIEQSRIHWMG